MSAVSPFILSALTQPLFVLRSANMQLTTDQQFVQQAGFTTYVPSVILAIRKTGATSVACLGGIYPAAAKAGSPLVAAAQSWLGLSGANKITSATLESIIGSDAQTGVPYLSLTTGSTAACTADVFIFGMVID